MCAIEADRISCRLTPMPMTMIACDSWSWMDFLNLSDPLNMPIWHNWGAIHAMPSTAGGQIISAVSQGHVIAARLVIDVWLRLWDQSVVSQGEERGRLFRGLNDKRGPTSQRKAEGTMPECNNQIEIGRRDTFLPS